MSTICLNFIFRTNYFLSWLEHHERILKLNQQAVIEAACHREEVVKDLMVTHCKLTILVHEAFCIAVWRNKILSKLLEENSSFPTFLIYCVLYHEATSISFLEVVLYHENGCEALGEASIDLIDYCVGAITQTIGLLNGGYNESVDTDELSRQMKDIAFQIGMKSITILSYLVDKIDKLPLSASSRLVRFHDAPCILSEVLAERPWMRRKGKEFEKYVDEKWTKVAGDEILTVTKVEAQTWFCIRQLIFNPKLMENYEITSNRQRELGKLSGLLNETILDQLPCLAELKHCLCTLQISGCSSTTKNQLIIEEVPEIKDKIMEKGKNIVQSCNGNFYLIFLQVENMAGN